MDGYEFIVRRIFNRRNFDNTGIVGRLQEAAFIHYIALSSDKISTNGYGEKLRDLTRRANMLALDTLENLLNEVTSRGIDDLFKEQETLVKIAEREWRGEMRIEEELDAIHMQRSAIYGVETTLQCK